MTPRAKAEELVKRYLDLLKLTDSCLAENCESSLKCQLSPYACEGWLDYAKKCTIIAVDEINDNVLIGIDLPSTWGNYWQRVKQEIEKL